MRMLFVNTLYPPDIGGGAEITLHSIVKGMLNRGHEVAVIATYAGSSIEKGNYDGVDVFRVPIKNLYWYFEEKNAPSWKRLLWHARDSYNVAGARQIAEIIERFRPDVVSCHNLSGHSAAVWRVLGVKKIPTIQVLHDYYAICAKVTMFNQNRNCAGACKSCHLFRLPHAALSNDLSAVVGVSQFILQRHLQAGLFHDVPIKTTVYNARSLAPMKNDSRVAGVFTFGFIGGLTPVKGIFELINAFAQLCRIRSEPLRLLVAGTGKEQFTARLKQLAHGLNVEFLGHVEPDTFFPQLDVAVVPSVWNEPLAGVTFEALGYGVPVIGSARGGTPEMVQHEKNGLIYEPNARSGLIDALARMVSDSAFYISARACAVASAQKFLDTDRMLNEHEELAHSMMAAPSYK